MDKSIINQMSCKPSRIRPTYASTSSAKSEHDCQDERIL